MTDNEYLTIHWDNLPEVVNYLRGDRSKRRFADELIASDNTIRNIERDRMVPSMHFLKKLAKWSGKDIMFIVPAKK